MNKKTTYLLLIVLTILIGTLLYYMFCCCTCNKNEKEYDKSSSSKEINLKSSPFELNDENFKYKTNDNFKFLNQNTSLIQPISDSLNIGIENLKNYLSNNPNKTLKITGYANKNEKNETLFPNLGYARANDLKNFFVSRGFDPKRFQLEGLVSDNWMMRGDTLIGPSQFNILTNESNITNNEVDWNALKKSINAVPLIIYFKTNQTNVVLTDEERQKIVDISKYLDNVPNSSILVEGHTDNVGSRDLNIGLGLKRANFVKEYLGKNGIDINKINSSSKGPDNPILPNDTEEGKAKNRRSIITIN